MSAAEEHCSTLLSGRLTWLCAKYVTSYSNCLCWSSLFTSSISVATWAADPATHPAPSKWTRGCPTDVCSAPCSSPYWPITTVHQNTGPISSRLQSTVASLVNNNDESSQLATWCSDSNLNLESSQEIFVAVGIGMSQETMVPSW